MALLMLARLIGKWSNWIGGDDDAVETIVAKVDWQVCSLVVSLKFEMKRDHRM